MSGISLAGEVRDRCGFDRHAGLAGHNGEGATGLHHRDHLRPFRRIGLRLERMTGLDRKTRLRAGLRKEHHHRRIGVIGEVHRDIGIRVRPKDPVRVAVDPNLAICRLEAQRAESALNRVSPGVERQGGRNSDEQQSCSKDGGRNLHRRKNLFSGLRPIHYTAYDFITYVLNTPVSIAGSPDTAEGPHHEQ